MARLLLVEDDEPTVIVLTRMLERAGYAVEVATDGLAAIELLASREFDALITDLMMPRMTGQQLCERVRAESRLRDLPIVIVTGMDEPHQLAWVEDLEPVDLLEKPVQVAELVKRLERLLVGSR